jgi:TonB family protein
MVKFQGVATLSLVVDASGKPTDIQIQSPLGLGLDEKAVEAVSKWKFEPAKKDGKPVPVAIAVEVDFHLN